MISQTCEWNQLLFCPYSVLVGQLQFWVLFLRHSSKAIQGPVTLPALTSLNRPHRGFTNVWHVNLLKPFCILAEGTTPDRKTTVNQLLRGKRRVKEPHILCIKPVLPSLIAVPAHTRASAHSAALTFLSEFLFKYTGDFKCTVQGEMQYFTEAPWEECWCNSGNGLCPLITWYLSYSYCDSLLLLTFPGSATSLHTLTGRAQRCLE